MPDDKVGRARSARRLGHSNIVQRGFRKFVLWPIVRNRHSPQHAARGAFIGLAIALTPTVGIQIPTVAALWLVCRSLRPEWQFSLVVAVAWTWITNIATVPAFYALFLATGQLLTGQAPAWIEFDGHATAPPSQNNDIGWLCALWIGGTELVSRYGLPMLIGSLPWALLGGCLGYRLTLRLARRLQLIRDRRILAKRRSAANATPKLNGPLSYEERAE